VPSVLTVQTSTSPCSSQYLVKAMVPATVGVGSGMTLGEADAESAAAASLGAAAG